MLSELISRGGPVMYLLLACSLVSVAIVLERAWFWVVELKRIHKKRLCCLLFNCEKEDSSSQCKGVFLKRIAALKKIEDLKSIEHLLRRESERAFEASIRNLNALDTVVSIAPLIGILGTVLGIMKSFHAMDLQHINSPGEVGHGLAEAMITTASGIAIAVPTLVLFNLFHSLAARHASTLYKYSEDVIEPSFKESLQQEQ